MTQLSNNDENGCGKRVDELKKPLDLNKLKEMMASSENGEFFDFFLNNQLCRQIQMALID